MRVAGDSRIIETPVVPPAVAAGRSRARAILPTSWWEPAWQAWTFLGRDGRRAVLLLLLAGLALIMVAATLIGDVRSRLADAQARAIEAEVSGLGPMLPALVDGEILTPVELAQVDELLERALPYASRTKIWSLDGVVIYSDDRSLIGRSDPASAEFLRHATEAGLLTRDVNDRGASANLDVANGSVIEHSIPLRDPVTGEPQAVLKVFQNTDEVDAALGELQVSSQVLTAIGSILLLTALFIIVGSRQRFVSEQRTRTARDQERRRIVGELHDSLAAQLVRALYATRRARLLGASGNGGEIGIAIDRVEALLERSEEQLRGFMRATRQGEDSAADIVSRLSSVVEAFRAESGLDASLDCDGDATRLSPQARRILAGAAEEVLLNVLKHADASAVAVSLQVGPAWAQLRVVDNGTGLGTSVATTDPGRGLGLAYLRERVAVIGGVVSIGPGPGSIGACLDIRVPIEVHGQ